MRRKLIILLIGCIIFIMGNFTLADGEDIPRVFKCSSYVYNILQRQCF